MMQTHRRSAVLLAVLLLIAGLAPSADAAASSSSSSSSSRKAPNAGAKRSTGSSASSGVAPELKQNLSVIQMVDGRTFEEMRNDPSIKLLVVLFTISPESASPQHAAQLKAWRAVAAKAEEAVEASSDVIDELSSFPKDYLPIRYIGIDMFRDYDVGTKLGDVLVGSIFGFRNGIPNEFAGHRTPHIIAKWIVAMTVFPVDIITTKEKKAKFDEFDWPKMVGYFESEDSDEYGLYKKLAYRFQGHVLASAIFDPVLARAFTIRNHGTVVVFRPYEKNNHLSIAGPMDEEEAVNSLAEASRQNLREIHFDNIYDAWKIDQHHLVLVVAFLRPHSEAGAALFDALKAVSKKLGPRYLESLLQNAELSDNQTGLLRGQRLRFIWVDPDKYPQTQREWMAQYGLTSDEMDGALGITFYHKPSVWYSSIAPRTSRKLESWILSTLNVHVPAIVKFMDDALSGRGTIPAASSSSSSSLPSSGRKGHARASRHEDEEDDEF